MADTANLISPSFLDADQNGVLWVEWVGINGTGSGVPVLSARYPDKTIHFWGTWGSATFKVQGSNDKRANPLHADHASAEWVDLTDAQGNVISKTDDAGEVIEENFMWFRPVATGGTSTSVTVSLSAAKTR